MDTRFLESFVTVVDLGSIAEAARRLNLTPAGVAQQLRSLENEIGSPLLSRAGRTVKPTETGIAILETARSLIRLARDLKGYSAVDRVEGELRLGATSTALVGILPPILTALTEKYRELEVYVVPGVSKDLYQDLCRGELDAAIIVEPRFAIPKTLNWQTLCCEPLVVLMPSGTADDHPNAILSTQPFIRYDRNHWGGQIVSKYLKDFCIRPNERLELDALDAIAALVDQGLGVSLVPDWFSPWPIGTSIKKLPIPDRSYVRRIGLVSTRVSPRARLVRVLQEEVMMQRFGNQAARASRPRENGRVNGSIRSATSQTAQASLHSADRAPAG